MYILKHLFYIPFLFCSLLTNAAEESLDLTKNNGVSWRINPKIPKIINQFDTPNVFDTMIRFESDGMGNVTSAKVISSTGNAKTDELIKNAVLNAKLRPYKENGVPTRFSADQPFHINATNTKKEKIYECKLVIKSNAYQVQQKFKSIKKALKKIDFVYLDEPTYRKSPSYSKSSNTTDFGEFKVTFVAPDGVIKRIDQREPTIEHVIVLNSIIGMKITPKKDIWNKGMHEYEDTFIVMRQCTTDPIN